MYNNINQFQNLCAFPLRTICDEELFCLIWHEIFKTKVNRKTENIEPKPIKHNEKAAC